MSIYRERFFPWLIDRLAGDEKLQAIRDRVVEKATGHVIEIGSGTGANFLSYTDGVTSLTVPAATLGTLITSPFSAASSVQSTRVLARSAWRPPGSVILKAPRVRKWKNADSA